MKKRTQKGILKARGLRTLDVALEDSRLVSLRQAKAMIGTETVALTVKSAAKNPSFSLRENERARRHALNRHGGSVTGLVAVKSTLPKGTPKIKGDNFMQPRGVKNRAHRRAKIQSPHLQARRLRHKARHGHYSRTAVDAAWLRRQAPVPSIQERAPRGLRGKWNAAKAVVKRWSSRGRGGH